MSQFTDTGRNRQRNEDALLGATFDSTGPATLPALVLAVADGMGGTFGGDVASRAVIDVARATLDGLWRSGHLTTATAWLDAYRKVFAGAIARLREEAHHDDALRGMGTTLTCLAAHDGAVAFGHIGDSRGYLFQAGALRRLTTDHNAASEMTRDGRLSASEASTHRSRHVLTRWLAPDAVTSDPEFGSLASQPGDVYLVCSDGLHAMIGDAGIEAALAQQPMADQSALDAVARTLIDRANTAGGKDNISVALGAWVQ